MSEAIGKTGTKNRRVVVVLALVGWFSALVWVIFHPGIGQGFEQSTPLLVVLAIAGVAPLYFLYRMAKRWPRLSVGIALAAICAVATSAYVVAHFLFHSNSVWLERMFQVGEWLFLLAIVLLVWKSAKGNA